MSTVIVSQPVRPVLPVVRWSTSLLTRWHLLSLDAPTVAVVWFFLLNRMVSAAHLKMEAAALAIAVWMIYVVDRLLDARRRNGALHRRHWFHWQHRASFCIALAVAGAVLTCLLFFLPASLFCAWSFLGLPLVLYAACVHFRLCRVPKECMVGVFFALVVGAPAWLRQPDWKTAVSLGAFGLLCCCNCLAITSWESKVQTDATRGLLLFRCAHLLLISLAVVCLFTDIAIGVACLLSAGLLVAMHHNRRRLEPVLLRSLADAALLTPLLVLPLVHRG